MSVALFLTEKAVSMAISHIAGKLSDSTNRELLVEYSSRIRPALSLMDNKKRISLNTQDIVSQRIKKIISIQAELENVTSDNVRVLMRKLDEVDHYPFVMKASDCSECRGYGVHACDRCERNPGYIDAGEADMECPHCDGQGVLMCRTCKNSGLGYVLSHKR